MFFAVILPKPFPQKSDLQHLNMRRPKSISTTLLSMLLLAHAANSEELSYYSSFDTPQTADIASGSAHIDVSDQLPFIDLITYPGGKLGKGVQLSHNQWLRIALVDNVSFEEGALSMWVSPNYDTPNFRETKGGAKQFLFAFDTRTGDRFELFLRNSKQTNLQLNIASNKGDRKAIKYVLEENWKKGEWYEVVVRWKRDGEISIAASDQKPLVKSGYNMPDIPEAMGFDFFIGSNAKVFAKRGGLNTFDGIIDELKIAKTFDYDFEQPIPTQKAKIEQPPPALPWVSQNDQRTLLHVTGIKDDRFTEYPVKVNIRVDGLESTSLEDKQHLMQSIRVVRYENNIAQAYNSEASGEAAYFIPYERNLNDYTRNEVEVSFLHQGHQDAWYGIYYSVNSPYTESAPLDYPMLGNGNKLKLGKKNTIGLFSSGISGAFDITDLDGDGDWDIWANHGTNFVRRGFDLNYGHFFYSGLANETGIPDLVDEPRRIISRNTPTGMIAGTVLPTFGDINSDGNLDVVMLERKIQGWWEFEMINGKPEITKMHDLPLTKPFDGREAKTTVYDYDKDGLLDIVVGFMRINPVGPGEPHPDILHVYKNIGTRTEPVFDNQNPINIDLPNNSPDEWHYNFIDLDNDGDDDLLSSNFRTRFYTYTNTGTNLNPKYENRKELQTFDQHEIYTPQQLHYTRIIDWDHDGDLDIIFAGENTSMGLLENIAAAGAPAEFRQTVWLQQRAPVVDAGSIAVPVLDDIDSDGDLDMIIGNGNPHIYLFENIGDAKQAVWAHRERIHAGGNPIDLRPGPKGSVQYEYESDWGYNNPDIADWDGDGLLDMVAQGNLMDHIYFKNIGSAENPYFARGEQLMLDAKGLDVPLPLGIRYTPTPGALITSHRSRPAMVDWNGDGLVDYVALDSESEVRVYLRERNSDGELSLTLGHTLTIEGNHDKSIAIARQTKEEWTRPGYAGRTVVNAVDWDNDGDFDLILNNINGRLYENVSGNIPNAQFIDRGNIVSERLSAHNCAPEIVDWDDDGLLDMFLGSEEGHVYYFSRAYIEHGNLPYTIHTPETRLGNSLK